MTPEMLAAVSGLVLAIVAVANSFFSSRKFNRELELAAKKFANERPLLKSQETLNIGMTYEGLVNQYQERVREVESQIKEVEAENKLLHEKIRQMRLEFDLKLSQALERIEVLEEENELLRGGRKAV